jgi:allophanate hydrolase
MALMNSLSISDLLTAYRGGATTPLAIMRELLARIEAAADGHIWISRVAARNVLERAQALAAMPRELPLYGIPFAIKDNIDLAAVPTTAGCPQYAYTPSRSAFVVEKLIAAGAIPLGKTNLDQFATGLVGTRSPYGACRNPFNGDYISGGSSSGSAVAVASGLASFSLGTDTAGSGRVPAAFNNIVGLKPSCGRISTRGVVPACRSLDAVSVFALNAHDAQSVLRVAEGYDADDAYSQQFTAARVRAVAAASHFKFGIPRREQLEFFGDVECARLFDAAIQRVAAIGGTAVEIDFAPFFAVARLLYEGPWVAERYAAVGEFVDRHPDAVWPTTREIIQSGRGLSAVSVFSAQYKLAEYRRSCASVWRDVDLLLTPTAGTIYRIAEVESDPLRLNTTLGYYTHFVNLLDLAAVALPAGFRADGLPFGVSVLGRRGDDDYLLAIADRAHRAAALPLGATQNLFSAGMPQCEAPARREVQVAVCGAHMQGLPLNIQLIEREARLIARTRTAPSYRLFALPGGPPQRPGLIKVPQDGVAIEVEVWTMPMEQFGSFVAGIPAPLSIGRVSLESGEAVSGFICEGIAAAGATDISAFGGWRAWLASRAAR